MQSFIREWSEIQHIVNNKPYDKFITDVSELLTNNYTIIEHKYLSNVQLTTTTIDMYYCIIQSLQTNVLYVLFSSGIVLTYNDLYNNSELNAHLMQLIHTLSNNKEQRFVLGGHSMGCVLALYTGFLMHRMPLFNRCFIVGTAGAKWIPGFFDFARESLVYNNIQVFISGSKQRKSMVLDSFFTKGDANLVAYTPITVLYYDTKTNVANQIPYDTIGCNITYSEKLHDWNYYKKLINLAL
jgi:hypothetical protein